MSRPGHILHQCVPAGRDTYILHQCVSAGQDTYFRCAFSTFHMFQLEERGWRGRGGEKILSAWAENSERLDRKLRTFGQNFLSVWAEIPGTHTSSMCPGRSGHILPLHIFHFSHVISFSPFRKFSHLHREGGRRRWAEICERLGRNF